LWRAIAQALDDEFFGLDSRRMKLGSFGMLCRAVVHCSTLEKALGRALRFWTFSRRLRRYAPRSKAISRSLRWTIAAATPP
jgi:hypothetical protein